MIIYRLTDRLPVKIGEITFWISPMSLEQRGRIAETVTTQAGNEREWALKAASLYIKYSVKAVDGLKLYDGSDYQVELDEDGTLSAQCVDEITQVAGSEKLVTLVNKVAFHDMGESKIDGVEVDFSRIKSVPKKS